MPDAGDQLTVFRRHNVTNGIRDIHGCGARLDYRLQNPIQESFLGTSGILGGKLHVLDLVAGVFYRVNRHLVNFLGVFAQFVFHMNRRGRYKDMNTRVPGDFQRLGRRVDVFLDRTGQPGDTGILDCLGDFLHRLKISGGTYRKSGFNDIHAQAIQSLRHFHLFAFVHAGARRLFTVPQGSVEN